MGLLSPERQDTITTIFAEERVAKLRRYTTRSIKESFTIYNIEHIYALHPKWAVPRAPRDVRLRAYCANFEVFVVTL